jgi:beta-1,4-mannosyltransferase
MVSAGPDTGDRSQRRDASRPRATVVVLGDLAHSPRMCLHALALAGEGFQVEIIAVVDKPIGRELATNAAVRIRAIKAASPAPRGGSRTDGVRKVAGQFVRFTAALWQSERADFVIVQNPPAVHILPLLLAICAWRRSRLIVDWHNFGWTILGLRLGQSHWLVAVAGWLERNLAARARHHVCVSAAMRDWLRDRMGVEATVLRDRPAPRFVELRGQDRGALRRDILPQLGLDEDARRAACDGTARIIVSATSWSRDEDFSLLLDALRLWTMRSADAPRPPLIVVVAGAGPLREDYEAKARAMGLPQVTLRTVWLSDDDYPRLLAAADLGVCLHRSSSGVDFPMKVVDMLGVGLPTCVLDYGPCLREVLLPGDNCVFFSDAGELMRAWLRLFVEEPQSLAAMRDRISAELQQTWTDHWRELLLPVITGAAGDRVP